MDVFVWTGHTYISVPPTSPPSGPGGADCDNGAALHFIADHTGDPTFPPPVCCYNTDVANVNHKEVRLGSSDCEVGIFLTCEWLRNRNNAPLNSQIKHMMDMAHLILGYATSSYFAIGNPAHEEAYGQRLAENLMGISGSKQPMKIIDAWHNASQYAQGPLIPDGGSVCARALYWDGDCENDYMLGNWRGFGMGGPPPPCYPDGTNEWQFSETTYWIY